MWNFKTNPETALNNREIDLPRGKVLGGSTSVNGMLYARGLSHDYNLWSQLGMPEWSWQSVRPFFLKSENYLGDSISNDHNRNGELAVSKRKRPVSPLAETYVEAGISAGYPRLNDFNTENLSLIHI